MPTLASNVSACQISSLLQLTLLYIGANSASLFLSNDLWTICAFGKASDRCIIASRAEVPTARPQALRKKCKNVLQSDRLNHFIMAVNHGQVRIRFINLLLRNFTHALLRMCLAQRARLWCRSDEHRDHRASKDSSFSVRQISTLYSWLLSCMKSSFCGLEAVPTPNEKNKGCGIFFPSSVQRFYF
jgi:hypothetical protein